MPRGDNAKLPKLGFVGDDGQCGTPFYSLAYKRVDFGAGYQHSNTKAVGIVLDNVERLCANRTGRTEDGYAFR
jgi:hypothetical protein